MKRPNLAMNGEPAPAMWSDDGFKLAYPNLYEHIHDQTYEDGTRRITSTLLVFNDGGVLKLCLSDRDNNRSVFVTAPTFDDAMVLLEQGLGNDSLAWKIKPSGNRQGAQPPF